MIHECTANLYCQICDTETHERARCPVFNAAKTYAIPAGYGVEKGGFFHIPTNKKLRKSKGDTRNAVIKVIEGEIAMYNVSLELDRLLPGHGP